MKFDLNSMTDQLEKRWPGFQPVTEDLRKQYPNLWTRFHTLPNGDRLPDTDKKYKEILYRHNTLLSYLQPGDSVIVVVSQWDTKREKQFLEANPKFVYWRTVNGDSDNADRRLLVGELTWRPGVVDSLLLAIADDIEAGVILAPKDFSWLYHPYDGGADIIMGTPGQAIMLKQAHKDWLPTHPLGL